MLSVSLIQKVSLFQKDDVQSLRNELRTLRSTLSENKRIALRRFEEHRQRDSRAALRQLQDKGQKPADPP